MMFCVSTSHKCKFNPENISSDPKFSQEFHKPESYKNNLPPPKEWEREDYRKSSKKTKPKLLSLSPERSIFAFSEVYARINPIS